MERKRLIKNKKIRNVVISIATLGLLATGVISYDSFKDRLPVGFEQSDTYASSLQDIPEYSGEAYINVEDGLADFDGIDWELGYEDYTSDNLGRCTTAEALVGKETMPTEERGDISSVKPTGWNNKKYDSDLVDGSWVYNRCHLIGYQLTGENDNSENLITGTRYLNIEGMLGFENQIADYIKETGNHVMYRVSPVYEGNNLVADGVVLEAKSLEDGGKGVNFDVYSYNVQPGIEIDYTNGDNWLQE